MMPKQLPLPLVFPGGLVLVAVVEMEEIYKFFEALGPLVKVEEVPVEEIEHLLEVKNESA